MKYCPLFMGGMDIDVKLCMEKRCAWWDKETSQCAVMAILQALRSQTTG